MKEYRDAIKYLIKYEPKIFFGACIFVLALILITCFPSAPNMM